MNEPSDVNKIRIGVVGAGSWGTALANLLGRKGYVVDLWVFEPDICSQIESERENGVFLPGFSLSENIHPTGDLERVVSEKDLVLVVVPSHVMRQVTGKMAPLLHKLIAQYAATGLPPAYLPKDECNPSKKDNP